MVPIGRPEVRPLKGSSFHYGRTNPNYATVAALTENVHGFPSSAEAQDAGVTQLLMHDPVELGESIGGVFVSRGEPSLLFHYLLEKTFEGGFLEGFARMTTRDFIGYV